MSRVTKWLAVASALAIAGVVQSASAAPLTGVGERPSVGTAPVLQTQMRPGGADGGRNAGAQAGGRASGGAAIGAGRIGSGSAVAQRARSGNVAASRFAGGAMARRAITPRTDGAVARRGGPRTADVVRRGRDGDRRHGRRWIGPVIIGGGAYDGYYNRYDSSYYDDDDDGAVYSYRSSNRWSEAALDRCEEQFRSFDRRTGTYTTYDGEKRLCPYLG